jgi:hypothetical protein
MEQRVTVRRCVLSFYAEAATAFDEAHQRFVERIARLIADSLAEPARIEIAHLQSVSR